MRTIALFLCLTAGPACGQWFALGVKGGLRASDDMGKTFFSETESKRYVVGPTVEIGLPGRWRVEVDALYHRFGYRTDQGSVFGSSSARDRGNSWEFPILLKCHLPARLFVSGGYAPRILSGKETAHNDSTIPFFGTRTFGSDFSYVSHGAVAGAGMEFGRGRLRFSPEFRYTRWKDKAIDIQGSRGFTVESNQNQIDVLFGMTWR